MNRITSVDAFRGFVMFLMLAEVLNPAAVAEKFPDCDILQQVKHHTDHVQWTGCSLHDLIQPGFTFLVGVALIFSLARRKEQPRGWLLLHAFWRSQVLIWLGVFLRSVNNSKTYFTFEDTLSQIGLGYLPLVALALLKPRAWLVALVAILIGYWAIFAFWPLPPEDFDRTTVGVKANWDHDFTGFEAHWNKNRNPATAFDAHFLKALREIREPDKPYQYNGGGYATLSFIPTLGTMILGLFAGRWLLTVKGQWGNVGLFLAVGIGLLAVGYALGHYGICPVVKRIWTPSWVLFSGGWCFLILAAFHATTDSIGYGGWSYPLRVIGANSILIYVIAHLNVEHFIKDSFRIHLGSDVFRVFGEPWTGVVAGAIVLLVYWLGLWWLYTRKVFVRV